VHSKPFVIRYTLISKNDDALTLDSTSRDIVLGKKDPKQFVEAIYVTYLKYYLEYYVSMK
jgi:hypothetical protein